MKNSTLSGYLHWRKDNKLHVLTAVGGLVIVLPVEDVTFGGTRLGDGGRPRADGREVVLEALTTHVLDTPVVVVGLQERNGQLL